MLSAMRHRAAELGRRCRYLTTDTYREALADVRGGLSVCQPTTWAALHLVDRLADERERRPAAGPRLHAPSRAEFAAWADGRGRKRLLMEDFYRDNRTRLDVLMDGVGARRRSLELRRREPRAAAQGRRHARRAGAGVAGGGRDRRGRSRRPRRDGGRRGRVRRRGRSAPVRGHPRRGAGRARRLRRAPAAELRPVRGRDPLRRPLDGPLAAVRTAQPRAARPGRGRPRRRAGVPRRGRAAGRGRGLRPAGDRAGGTTSGTSTGISARTTGRTTS